MSYYLGPGRQSVHLSTLEELTFAAEGGLLSENQWCELKVQLGPSNKAVNTELARDLASLSIDGGVLIFGVADKTYKLVGCDSTSLETRISQVAATVIEPPLSPVFNPPIQLPNGKSVIVIAIPPSAVAPHMADGRYWGRSSEGKRVLSDTEVRRIFQARVNQQELFAKSFEAFVEQDPLRNLVDGGETKNGHGFFFAKPQGQLTLENFDTAELRAILARVRQRQSFEDLLKSCFNPAHDPNGVGLRSVYEAVSQRNEKNLRQITVRDDGSVSSTFAAASVLETMPGEEEVLYTFPGTTALFLAQNLEILSLISEDFGYQGGWEIALRLTGLKGVIRYTSDFSYRPTPYPQKAFSVQRVVQPMSWVDNTDCLGDLTMSLLRGYLRGLGIERYTYENLMNGV